MADDKCLLGIAPRQPRPEFYTLFQKYSAVFSPWAYRETSPEGKRLLGELLCRDLPLIELLESHCTTKRAIILINTLACVAVELSKEGYLDTDPWEDVIKRFGDKTELYIGRPRTMTPGCTWLHK